MDFQDNLSFIEKLAHFFPEVVPMNIPIRVSGSTISGHPFSEKTAIEYGAAREVIFGSRLPLEFAERFRIESLDGSMQTEASVVALHYYEGTTTAVAARIETELPNREPHP